MSLWQGFLTPERLKANDAWYRRGKHGDGRLVMEDRDLSGAQLKFALSGARFVRCNLAQAKLPYGLLDEIELVDCNLDDSALSFAGMRRSLLERSTFRRANFVLAKLDSTKIDGGSFAQMNAENTTWFSVQARGVDFRGARFPMAKLNDASFEDCDFRDAQLVRGDPEHDSGTAWSTRFVNCDFTGADLSGWRLRVTSFERCKLSGARGKPVIEEPISVRDNDVSETSLLAKWR